MLLPGLYKPEYWYQPQRLLQRLLPQPASATEFVKYRLPWGLEIQARPQEEQGTILHTLGVIDLAVTETLWRLTEPGEQAIDVGANIGYMTALLAARVGDGGTVTAFEAHPEIFSELADNVAHWQRQLPQTRLEIHACAVSHQAGQVALTTPPAFGSNRGLAQVLTPTEAITTAEQLTVPAATLEQFFTPTAAIGVMKLDVEGHEYSVLQGATGLLERHQIRDLVFEEHNPYPSAVTQLLEALGYHVFRIQRQFRGPALLPPDSPVPRSIWEPTSFLATCQVDRVRQRLQPRGWQVFNPGIQ